MGLPVEQPCGSEWLFMPLPEFCSGPAADVKGQGPLRDSQLAGLHWSRGWLELLKSPEQHLVSASLFFFFFFFSPWSCLLQPPFSPFDEVGLLLLNVHILTQKFPQIFTTH